MRTTHDAAEARSERERSAPPRSHAHAFCWPRIRSCWIMQQRCALQDGNQVRCGLAVPREACRIQFSLSPLRCLAGRHGRDPAKYSRHELRGQLHEPQRHRPATQERRSKPKRFSRLYAPSDVAPEVWQVALRRQYGREQKFKLENLGKEAVFSEFRITNPFTGGRYRVAIRSAGLGESYCSCPDYQLRKSCSTSRRDGACPQSAFPA